jgi:hypothetical protein
VQKNLFDYKCSLDQKEIFKEFEKKKVEQFLNYRVYGARGFRLFFQPAPISIFFIKSVPLPDMNAFADSTEQLNFYKPINTKTVFELRKNWFTDYSGILLLIGSLLSLFYGFQSFKHPEYLQFLTTITSRQKLFWNVFFARGLLLFLILLVFWACSLLLVTFNGFMVSIDKYALSFLLNCFWVLLLTFSVGLFSGTIKVKISGILIALLIWAVIIFIIPAIPEIVIADKSDTMTPIYKFEMDKLIIFMDWEKNMKEKEEIPQPGEKSSERFKNRLIEYKQNELKKLQRMEEVMIAQLERNKRTYQLISSFFPTTFYQSVNNEISSRGYNNLVDFCKFALKQKLQFIDIIIEKEYFSNYSKVEQFSNDNIYQAHSSFPEYYIFGIILAPLWIMGFVILTFYLYKKSLYELPEKKKNMKVPDINLKKAHINSWHITNNLLSRILYCMLANVTDVFKKKGYAIKVSLDNLVLNIATQAQNFIYLCHPSAIPGFIRVDNFLRLVMGLLKIDETKRNEIIARFSLDTFSAKKFSELELDELGNIFLAILDMKQFDIYLIDDISRGMYGEFCFALKSKMDDLSQSDGAAVIFLSTDFNYLDKEKAEKGFFEFNGWLVRVEETREIMAKKD